MRKEEIRPFAWGVVVGAIALPIIIFSTGLVVTSSSARETATQTAEKAVVDNLAPICVTQFPQDATRPEQLKALKELNSWKRGDFVAKNGWAIMPGGESADREVAEACATLLMQLEK